MTEVDVEYKVKTIQGGRESQATVAGVSTRMSEVGGETSMP